MNRRGTRLAAGIAVLVLLTAGCSSAIAGQAVKVGAGSTTSQDPPPDGPNGLKANAPQPTVKAEGVEQGNKYDELAEATIEDLYTFYGEVFPRDFDKEFTPAMVLESYDSTTATDRICGLDVAERVNASYIGGCDGIIWDRGVLMPSMEDKVGELSAPTILAHEMGHLVQARLGQERSSVLLLEQQADCYAGAYWRWVADGNSKFFDFSAGVGMRQVLSAMMFIGDPVGLPADNDGAHGSSFDRTFAASIGFANGPKRCSEITPDEVDQRAQQIGFSQLPENFANIEVSGELITQVTATLDEYFGATVPGYAKPQLQAYEGDAVPACDGTTPQVPVDYCPATRTVRYNLADLQEIGTPTGSWATANGDFSAMMLVASRYALAAQATGGGTVDGDQAGLRGLCYAGTWAEWMREPRGDKNLTLSPNDLDKAIYQVVNSPFAAGDVNSRTGTAVLDQVQALHIGVAYDITTCFKFYGP